ncbi:MAG TPA: DUF488 family protein [Rhizomicrobium sp.]|nr:DUF488 family protein [Rhizomicrobium sp.]
MTFQIKRIYDKAKPGDGRRVLVDRLWPRGVKKSSAHLDDWMKEVAPSARLRQWFGHKPERFVEFRHRYRKELAGSAGLARLKKLGRDEKVTLLYGAKDPKINHAVVLLAALKPRKKKKTKRT